MKSFFVSRWFLIVLAVVLVVGIFQASRLQWTTQHSGLRYTIVAAVLFVMALPLRPGAIWRTLRRPWAPLLAAAINLGFLPLFAWGVAFAMTALGVSAEMGPGLLIAATVPCTLASAAVWTRRAGGNDSVAILVTLVTNAICFIVTPLWLVWMTGELVGISLGEMVWNLAVTVVLPMAAAQVARLFGSVGDWATRNKTTLGVLAQCGVLTMVLFGAVQTGLKLQLPGEAGLAVIDVLPMIVAVLVVHLTMLFAGVAASTALGFGREDSIAVGFAGSQKTLMVGLQIGMELHITVLPMVAYHVCQLLVDTLIADRFGREAGERHLGGEPSAALVGDERGR